MSDSESKSKIASTPLEDMAIIVNGKFPLNHCDYTNGGSSTSAQVMSLGGRGEVTLQRDADGKRFFSIRSCLGLKPKSKPATFELVRPVYDETGEQAEGYDTLATFEVKVPKLKLVQGWPGYDRVTVASAETGVELQLRFMRWSKTRSHSHVIGCRVGISPGDAISPSAAAKKRSADEASLEEAATQPPHKRARHTPPAELEEGEVIDDSE